MADTIQRVIEQFVPELEYYRDNKLFTSEEIRKIVAKRTNFEYQLRSRAATKQAYLDAIEWERNLNRLKGRRTEKNKLAWHYLEMAGIRRIHKLYKRALSKYQGEIDLWLAYAEFAKLVNSEKGVSWAYGQALLSHSGNEELWIRAASWEADHHGNYPAARKLLQRALISIPKSENIYLVFFKMEIRFLELLKSRKDLLGISKTSGKQNDFIKSVVIPKLIAETALEELRSTDIILKLLKLVPEDEDYKVMRNTLYLLLERDDVLASVQVCECLSKRALTSHEGQKGVRERKAVRVWDRALGKAEDRDLIAIGFLHYITRRIRVHNVESKLRGRLLLKLVCVIKMSSTNLDFLITGVEYLNAITYFEKAVKMAQKVVKTFEKEPRIYPLLTTALVLTGRRDEALNLITTAMKKAPSAQAALLICDLTLEAEADPHKLKSFFESQITSFQTSFPIFAERYWTWILTLNLSGNQKLVENEKDSESYIENALKFLLEYVQFLPDSLYPLLIAHTIAVGEVAKTRRLFEASLKRTPANQKLWTHYIDWSRKCEGEAAAEYLQSKRHELNT